MIPLLAVLTILGISEYAVIALLLMPYGASTQNDWLIATLGIAPALTIAVVWPLMVFMRICDDAVEIWRRRVTGDSPDNR